MAERRRVATKTKATTRRAPDRKKPAARKATAKVRPLKGGRLERYHEKRNFAVTPEPTVSLPTSGGDMFVVQKHAATRLHYDFRIEVGGVLRSWAITKAPSRDPGVKRLAVHVEDHPVSYGDFEGTIPEKQYGAGTVIVWDRGTWTPANDIEEGYKKGEIKMRLDGTKLKGGFVLVRLRDRDPRDKGKNWLFIKEKDGFAEPGSGDALGEQEPRSVISGLTIEDMAKARRAPTEAKPARKKLKRVDPATLPKARKAKLDKTPEPQLASLGSHPPHGDGWVHEIKYDGYRTLARVENGAVRLITRNGHDWTERYQPIAAALARLPCSTAVVDGEVCVQTASGSTSFSELQDALAVGDPSRLTYFAFDLLYLDGYDLRSAPLVERKRALEALVASVASDHGVVHYSEHYEGDGDVFLAQVLRLGLEGIISKEAEAPYESGRSRTWMKSKGAAAHEFAIVGFTESKAAGGLASLLLAETVADGLQYVGKAGTGFTVATAKDLKAKLEPLLRKEPIFTLKIAEKVAGAKWVEPKLFAEIEYANKTGDGHLRAARYKGLRGPGGEDSPMATATGGSARGRPAKLVSDLDLAQVNITNPDRRMFSADGPTKLDLAVYYARVGDWILPHIANRPLTLVRSPSGKVTDRFYQRHVRPGMPDEVKKIDLTLPDDKDREEYLYITDVKGLLGLVQFGVIEIHPWGCKIDKPERPDRMVFDLDPDEGLDWRKVVEASFEVRDFLTSLGFTPFVRTTGGKGIHVVVAVERQSAWDEFKEFSHMVVQALAARAPLRYTASIAKKDRKGRIFIDYLRNGRMATAAASYSLRARAGVPASCNLTWDELYDLDDPQTLNWKTVPLHLDSLDEDPWAGIEESAQRITKAMQSTLQKFIKG